MSSPAADQQAQTSAANGAVAAPLQRDLSVAAKPFVPRSALDEIFQGVHNLHYNDAIKNQIPFVPYAIKGSEYDLPSELQDLTEDIFPDKFKFAPKTYDKFPQPVTLYIGGLGLTPTRNQVWNLLTAIGISSLRVAIGKINTNKDGKKVAPIAMIEVKSIDDARKAIACLDRRALLDQTGFYLAQTRQQVEILTRYCVMLRHFKNAKTKWNAESENNSPTFIHRPHRLLTVSLEYIVNAQNPLCDCNSCTEFFTRFEDFSFVDEYTSNTYAIFCGDFSNLRNKLILTHAFRVDSNLNEEENNVYCDIPDPVFLNCRALVSQFWPDYRETNLSTSGHLCRCSRAIPNQESSSADEFS